QPRAAHRPTPSRARTWRDPRDLFRYAGGERRNRVVGLAHRSCAGGGRRRSAAARAVLREEKGRERSIEMATIMANCTCGKEDPERATLPFIVGNVAASADQ